jgi:hypothetical protein
VVRYPDSWSMGTQKNGLRNLDVHGSGDCVCDLS